MEMGPLVNEIHHLRKALEMPLREFEDDELYGTSALPDRRDERDELRDQLARKKELEPILAEIQKLRKGLDLTPRQWNTEEIFGPNAVAERIEERDQLREVKPICEEIHQLRSKLAMDPRDVGN